MVNIAQFGEKALRVAYRLQSSSWARFNASRDSASPQRSMGSVQLSPIYKCSVSCSMTS
jgi:hypothetical protein